jgi:hypothetical protein
MLRQNLAAAVETALDDLHAKGIDVGDVLVVLDYGGVCSGVNRCHVDARLSLQLLLDPSMVENREHAADFENSRFHTALLTKFAIISVRTPTRRHRASGRRGDYFFPAPPQQHVSAALDGLACPTAAWPPDFAVLLRGSAAASPPQQPWPGAGTAEAVVFGSVVAFTVMTLLLFGHQHARNCERDQIKLHYSTIEDESLTHINPTPQRDTKRKAVTGIEVQHFAGHRGRKIACDHYCRAVMITLRPNLSAALSGYQSHGPRERSLS